MLAKFLNPVLWAICLSALHNWKIIDLAHGVAQNNWERCVGDIQAEISMSLRDVFTSRAWSEEDLIYIDPAQHWNLGDSFIVEGTYKLLESFGYKIARIHSCKVRQGVLLPSCNFEAWLNKDSFLAIWHGGGNWGDLWGDIHPRRLRSMETLLLKSNATIISFPQSIHYNNNKTMHDHARLINHWIESSRTSSRLILSFRQANQFELAKSLYPKADVRLVPDAAFMIGPVFTSQQNLIVDGESSPSLDIIFVLRRDKESMLNDSALNHAMDALRSKSPSLQQRLDMLHYKRMDWRDMRKSEGIKRSSGIRDSLFKLKLGTKWLSRAKVVVTDRLHCSILCVLMNKAHVFLEQNYDKISNTRITAFQKSPYCNKRNLRFAMSSSLSDAIESAIQLVSA